MIKYIMRKISILKRKLIRAWNNPRNKKFSEFKGYPVETYFGYYTLDEMINSTFKNFKAFYGDNLRKWRYI